MQQPEASRYINSVSDLYGTDEIEFLLDDIRDLEPASCKPEDIQVSPLIAIVLIMIKSKEYCLAVLWSLRIYRLRKFHVFFCCLCKGESSLIIVLH